MRLLALVLIFILLGGCSPKELDQAEEVTVRVAGWGDLEEKLQMEQYLQVFMDEYPHIRVSLELSPLPILEGQESGFIDGYEHRILSELSGGHAPDVMLFHNLRLYLYATRGAFLPLNAYLQEIDTRFWPRSTNPGEGHFYYAVPHLSKDRAWTIYARTRYPDEAFLLIRHLADQVAEQMGLESYMVPKVDDTDHVQFSCQFLDQSVREAAGLDLSWGPIHRDDIQSITALRATAMSLEGIEALTNLRTLEIQGGVSDLRPLMSLANLESLSLEDHAVMDLLPLTSLTSLKRLSLTMRPRPNQSLAERLPEGIALFDFLPLASLPNLHTLVLRGNGIRDIRSLVGMSNLALLDLSGNPIDAYTGLASLPNLRTLILQGNGLTDLDGLKGLQNLTSLDVSQNSINDFSPLSGLLVLDTLIAQNNRIQNVASLTGLSSLLILDLSNNQIIEFGALDALPNLHSLILRENPIRSLAHLAGRRFPTWMKIDLSSTQVSSLAGLDQMGQVSEIRLFDIPADLRPDGPNSWVLDQLRSQGTRVFYSALFTSRE